MNQALPASPFSANDLFILMERYEIPDAPRFDSYSDVVEAPPEHIEAAKNRYHYRSVLFHRIAETWGEDALEQATLILGWPSDEWEGLDKWGSRLNGYATADDAPKWLVKLRGREQ